MHAKICGKLSSFKITYKRISTFTRVYVRTSSPYHLNLEKLGKFSSNYTKIWVIVFKSLALVEYKGNKEIRYVTQRHV